MSNDTQLPKDVVMYDDYTSSQPNSRNQDNTKANTQANATTSQANGSKVATTTTNGNSTYQFIINLLNGLAIGIVVGLVANAALGILLNYLANAVPGTSIFQTLKMVSILTQFATAPLIGMMVGLNFKLSPLKIGCLVLVAFVSAGNVVFTPTGMAVHGLGDVLNILVACGIAVFLMNIIKDSFGSLSIILLPIVIGVGVGYLSTLTMNFTHGVTSSLGDLIKYFINFSPLIAGPVIAMIFAFATSSPLSSVGLAFITTISGYSAGVACIGCAAASAFLSVGSWKSNGAGIRISLVIFGIAKMMVPCLVKKPIMYVAMILTAGISGFLAIEFLQIIVSTKATGFGYTALIGPFSAYELMPKDLSSTAKLIQIALGFIVIPFVTGAIVNFVFVKVLKLYTPEDLRLQINIK